MAQVYEDRPAAVLPGSGGTVSGVAVADWLDDEGNPKFGSVEENRQDAAGEPQEPPD